MYKSCLTYRNSWRLGRMRSRRVRRSPGGDDHLITIGFPWLRDSASSENPSSCLYAINPAALSKQTDKNFSDIDTYHKWNTAWLCVFIITLLFEVRVHISHFFYVFLLNESKWHDSNNNMRWTLTEEQMPWILCSSFEYNASECYGTTRTS